jgi:hypothetical protein
MHPVAPGVVLKVYRDIESGGDGPLEIAWSHVIQMMAAELGKKKKLKEKRGVGLG